MVRNSLYLSLISSLSLLGAITNTSCGVSPHQVAGSGSSPVTVDMPHTQVKWQSIGNCWIYAALGWMESRYLAAHGQELNLSETYLTYRHFEEQLMTDYGALDELSTGGSWSISTSLMLRYGVMMEGDFIPNESHETFSETQARAVEVLNASLAYGALSQDKSVATVRSELDRAFGVNMEQLQDKIYSLDELKLTEGHTMTDEIRSWTVVRWPLDFSRRPSMSQLPVDRSKELTPDQVALLGRVKRALNDGYPVVMNWWVDFNALDPQGAFDLEMLKFNGPGSQGYHSTVIEDYVVTGVDPRTGLSFRVGEGEATAAQKALAAEFGEIEYFVIKNSWGGSERTDRPSYSRFGEKGYAKLNANYLFAWMKQVNKEREYTGMDTGINGFILPIGY